MRVLLTSLLLVFLVAVGAIAEGVADDETQQAAVSEVQAAELPDGAVSEVLYTPAFDGARPEVFAESSCWATQECPLDEPVSCTGTYNCYASLTGVSCDGVFHKCQCAIAPAGCEDPTNYCRCRWYGDPRPLCAKEWCWGIT